MKTAWLILGVLVGLAIPTPAQPVGQSSATNSQTNPNDNGAVVHIKLVGDETHISAIKASPRSFIQKTVTVVGGIRTANYYNWGYENAQSTHFSLDFVELTENLKVIGDLNVYAGRSISQPLVNAIIKNEASGLGKLVRLKIVVTHRSFEDNDFKENAELVDWQFWDRETSTWAPWGRETIATKNAALQATLNAELERQRKIQQEKNKIARQMAAAAALKSNQDAAAKGDMFGLLRMGERYRDGDGMEKDLAKAKEYLQKAADAGSPTAKDELSKLNQP